jgi:hypothetical protein
MKHILFLIVFVIAQIYPELSFGKDLSKLSVVSNNVPTNSDLRIRIGGIDKETFFMSMLISSRDVLPGSHEIILDVCTGGGASGQSNCSKSVINCETEPGISYTVSLQGCIELGRRMDFDGAKEYWAKYDSDKQQAALEAAEALRHKREAAELANYQAAKESLANANSKADIEAIISAVLKKVQFGINREDPDNLLKQAKLKLAPYLQAEAEENARQDVIKAKEAVRQAKEEGDRKTRERQQIAAFRKSIDGGAETNCGPVIEVKGKLVKVSYAVSNYGNEHWIRRDDIFPAGYGCRFYNGEYQPPQ